MKTIIKPRTGILVMMILGAGIWRLIFTGNNSFMANFIPVGAMALFGGCYFSDKWKAYIVPLLTLWLSDLALNYTLYLHHWTWFYPGFYWTYGSFALIVMLGTFIKKVNFGNTVLAAIAAAILHFIITNFGTWVSDGIYPMTKEGLITCYVAAIPFFINMLVANLLFAGVMFGSFEWAQNRFPSLEASKA